MNLEDPNRLHNVHNYVQDGSDHAPRHTAGGQGPERGGVHMQEVHIPQAAEDAPLQRLQPVHTQDGPPLPVVSRHDVWIKP